jgi:type II secretory pathway component GspD/PulD (secretin)
MLSVVRAWRGVMLPIILALVPMAAAQEEQLQAAIHLYEQQEYKAAQEALLRVNRGALTDAQRDQLDGLLKVLPEAINGSEKAAQDLADGEAAFDVADWDTAERHFRAVQDNKYATPQARERAVTQNERIAEKRRLAEAAKPSGPVEGTPVTQPTGRTPTPPGGTPTPSGQEPAPPSTEPGAPTPPPVPPGEAPPGVPPAPPEAAPQTPPPASDELTPRRLTPADELRMRDELLWQRAVAIAESLAAGARTDIANQEFTAARTKAATAMQTIEAAASYAEPVSKYQAAKAMVQQLEQELDQAADEYARVTADRQRQEVRNQIERRRQQIEQQKKEKTVQLFNSVEQLRRERRFAEAAEVLREILRIDPSNAEARYQLNWAEDLESFSEQGQWQHDLDVQRRRALQNANESLIPWDVDVMYPRNWLELTAQRSKTGVSGGRDIGDVELNRQLDTTLPSVRFEETPLEQVFQFLTDMTKANISVDWTDLTDNTIDREKPISIQLNNVTFRSVLKEVLSQAGGETKLAFEVGDGLLRIATKDKLDKDKSVLIYDIRDLLVSLPRATRQGAFNVTQGLGQTSGQGGGGGGGAGGGMFGQSQGQQQQQQGRGELGQGGQPQLVQQILDIIRQTVEPDSWRETGGGDASLRELNGQLVIYNTSDAHRQVADLLSQLRETRALQISVESRFLNVTNNFLEQFGVDLDFVFNSGSAGYDQATGAQGVITDPATGAVVLIPRPFSRIGALPTAPPFGTPLTPGTPPIQPYSSPGLVPADSNVWPVWNEATPITVQQGSLTLAQPNVSTGIPGSFGSTAGLTPALNIAGSFLDNIQVDFLVRATQANSRSSIMQAPRLVIFNGQASRIDVGKTRTYVASLEARLAEGAVGFNPITNQVASGVQMYVEGTISADRRYVTLTLDVAQRDEPILTNFEVQRASGNSPGAFITLPTESFATLATTVSVPDGGTVLLGGLKQSGEIEVEAGVPILSKIPVLKRAFTNESTVKDTRTLLILVKAKIIIQKEAEDEAFPTFSKTGA